MEVFPPSVLIGTTGGGKSPTPIPLLIWIRVGEGTLTIPSRRSTLLCLYWKCCYYSVPRNSDASTKRSWSYKMNRLKSNLCFLGGEASKSHGAQTTNTYNSSLLFFLEMPNSRMFLRHHRSHIFQFSLRLKHLPVPTCG